MTDYLGILKTNILLNKSNPIKLLVAIIVTIFMIITMMVLNSNLFGIIYLNFFARKKLLVIPYEVRDCIGLRDTRPIYLVKLHKFMYRLNIYGSRAESLVVQVVPQLGNNIVVKNDYYGMMEVLFLNQKATPKEILESTSIDNVLIHELVHVHQLRDKTITIKDMMKEMKNLIREYGINSIIPYTRTKHEREAYTKQVESSRLNLGQDILGNQLWEFLT